MKRQFRAKGVEGPFDNANKLQKRSGVLECVLNWAIQFSCFVVAFAICASTFPVEAKNMALLIGISEYQLQAIPKLRAPRNDVALMWDLLRERGFHAEDITVLADQIDPDHKQTIPHEMPAADNILGKLDALAASAKENDLVVVYYSGHGSYVRQGRPKVGETIEQSGFNQVLLAIDAKKADDIKAEVPGGILDKVLKAKFDAIKKKAFLWLILDSCHAGGFTRDVTVGAAVHFVPPDLLNLDGTPPPGDIDPNRWIAGGIGGRQVAFLAAPEDSPAFEKAISDLGNKAYSLFTLSLVRLLQSESFGSYRSLGEAIISKQAALPGNVPTPVIEGDLDQPIFDGTVEGPRVWDAKYDESAGKVLVDAGALQGIGVGTIISLETGGGVLGYGEVESSTPLSSISHPIAFQGKPTPPSKRLKEKLIARVVRSTIDFTLGVRLPPADDMDGSEASKVVSQAIGLLQKEQNNPLPIRWLRPDMSADVYLRLINGVIYLVPGTGELVRRGRRQTRGIPISDSADDTAGDLKENLWRVLRQLNLRRAADEVASTDFARAVDVHLSLVRDPAQLKAVKRNERQPCRNWESGLYTTSPKPLEPGLTGGVKLTHCDRVKIEVANRWPKAIDVTLLYLDSEGGIGALEGDDPRVNAGKAFFPREFQPVRIVTWCDAKVWSLCKNFKTSGFQPIGWERLLVIIEEAGATKHTYYYLAQGREGSPKPERSGAPLEELLIDAGLYPEKGRGVVYKAVPATIKLFSWDVVPPAELRK